MEIKVFKKDTLLYHYADFYDVEVQNTDRIRIRKFLLNQGLRIQSISFNEWDKMVITKPEEGE